MQWVAQRWRVDLIPLQDQNVVENKSGLAVACVGSRVEWAWAIFVGSEWDMVAPTDFLFAFLHAHWVMEIPITISIGK